MHCDDNTCCCLVSCSKFGGFFSLEGDWSLCLCYGCITSHSYSRLSKSVEFFLSTLLLICLFAIVDCIQGRFWVVDALKFFVQTGPDISKSSCWSS